MPHVEPARSLRTLFRDITFSFMLMACCLKVRRGSRVTPRILGSFLVGTAWPSILMGREMLSSLENVVKRVAEDLEADIKRFLSLKQMFNVSR